MVFDSDVHDHVGRARINTGYADVHGGFGYGIRNTDGSRILEFTDNLDVIHVLCSRILSRCLTESGPHKSTVDHVLVRN